MSSTRPANKSVLLKVVILGKSIGGIEIFHFQLNLCYFIAMKRAF